MPILRLHSVPGLVTCIGFVSNPDELLAQVRELRYEPLTAAANSRRVAHFGYRYRYFGPAGLELAPPIPDFLRQIADTIPSVDGHIGFDQIIINEYKPGQCIAPHVDNRQLFGPVVAGISLGAAATMKFTNGAKTAEVVLVPGSLVILSADARNVWKHSIKNNTNKTRYSITFRTKR